MMNVSEIMNISFVMKIFVTMNMFPRPGVSDVINIRNQEERYQHKYSKASTSESTIRTNIPTEGATAITLRAGFQISVRRPLQVHSRKETYREVLRDERAQTHGLQHQVRFFDSEPPIQHCQVQMSE